MDWRCSEDRSIYQDQTQALAHYQTRGCPGQPEGRSWKVVSLGVAVGHMKRLRSANKVEQGTWRSTGKGSACGLAKAVNTNDDAAALAGAVIA